MKLLVIPDKYLPDETAGGAIYSDLCAGLAARGFEVTVRCPYPFYPEWRDKSGWNGWQIWRSRVDEVAVERFGMFIPRNPRSAAQRIALEASFFGSLLRSLPNSGRFDAILAMSPHLGGLGFAALVKCLHRTPIFLSVQDLPADAARASGIAPPGRFQRLLHAVQQVLFNQADHWQSISPAMVKRLAGLRLREQPLSYIPLWTHPSLAREIAQLPPKIGRPVADPPKLFYSGNIGAKQGLLEFCEALSQSHAPFSFVIRGGGGQAEAVRAWVQTRADGRFSFGPLVAEADFALALHEADLFVVTEKAGAGAAFFPSKTIPSMALGTPILAISDAQSPLGREVLENDLGPWLPWDQLATIGARLAELGQRPDDLRRWQGNCQRRSLVFDRTRCLDQMEATFLAMVARERR